MTPIKRSLLCPCGLRLHANSVAAGKAVCGRCTQRKRYLARVAREAWVGRVVGEWLARVLKLRGVGRL
jgi:hypothetical protein